MRLVRLTKSLVLHALLGAIGVLTVFPFAWMLVSSFKSNSEINAAAQSFWPKSWTLDNYVSVQEKLEFFRLFANSIFLSVVITAIVIYTSLLGGFVFAKYQFRGRGAAFAIILSTMMITWAVVIIPRYTLFESAGLRGSYASIIIPAAISGFGIFMMRQSMTAVPDEILEAARIDGASEPYIFHRIVAPMCRNAISALAIFQFLWVWEDYLWPYLMITSQEKQVLAVGLTTFNGQYGTDYGGLFAATTISVVPVLVVYVVFQRRFVAGAASAAVKG
ncbi:carbohydrate ABC transporter permease [Buchananella hordeovulneris]|uniref:Sugar ABC transporter permease n=2 Tax=Buchananella hordeovulneris TaxID=52770 RepID=A0A1Q5PXN1_9ACTO|nr:sugar ABC transporter permease [Buchananella hordeovulneris]RRD45574.1 carbohydrate ABC transporter permease [Buchananella hordeovulneris]RRD53946.1 carbohydrate ABC transporter permease [Buchananella hordeovulneris]